jgi:hypothetical protein
MVSELGDSGNEKSQPVRLAFFSERSWLTRQAFTRCHLNLALAFSPSYSPADETGCSWRVLPGQKSVSMIQRGSETVNPQKVGVYFKLRATPFREGVSEISECPRWS